MAAFKNNPKEDLKIIDQSENNFKNKSKKPELEKTVEEYKKIKINKKREKSKVLSSFNDLTWALRDEVFDIDNSNNESPDILKLNLDFEVRKNKDKLNRFTRNDIDSLKLTLNEDFYTLKTEDLLTWKLFKNINNIEKILNNPETIREYSIWWAVGLVETSAYAWKIVFDWTKWIVKAPIDLYKIATKKWEYDWFKVV